MQHIPMQLPFGAVYFRKSNPPREDWERDYRVASEDGMNIFRHWFMWGSIERRPGVFDWNDYDRQMDLAAENGIKTIVAEVIHSVPDWALDRFSNAFQIADNGEPAYSVIGGSSATGGFPNIGGSNPLLTLNCAEFRDAAGGFLSALSERYKDHPAMLGYDIWNECNYAANADYSSFSKAAFRVWLQEKYSTIEQLASVWHRYSYEDWDQIQPPVRMSPSPECMDWLAFKHHNNYAMMQWRVDTIRKVHPDALITAHGVAGSTHRFASSGCDEWLAASKVEVYGFTFVASRHGNEAWKHWHAVDQTRAGSRGRVFWHAETQGGPLWLQPQLQSHPKTNGRVTEPEDIRVWNMTSLAGGARGLLNPRFRPLLDGPLFGAFGAYGMDGSRTPRSDMASRIGQWANTPNQRALMAASPVRGDIGVVVSQETQRFDYLLSKNLEHPLCPQAIWGAYRGFFDNGLQPDLVHLDDIGNYSCLYFPYPIMMSARQAERLSKWVRGGGLLISEGCPAYFGEGGRVGVMQPNYGLAEMFGAVQDEVEFLPDIGNDIKLSWGRRALSGAGFRQLYRAIDGRNEGQYSDGSCAIVSNDFGEGRTLLVGTHPSIAYHHDQSEQNHSYFDSVFAWLGRPPNVKNSNRNVHVRVHQRDESVFVWVVNPTRQPQQTTVSLNSSFGSRIVKEILWGEPDSVLGDETFSIPARDAVVVQFA